MKRSRPIASRFVYYESRRIDFQLRTKAMTFRARAITLIEGKRIGGSKLGIEMPQSTRPFSLKKALSFAVND